MVNPGHRSNGCATCKLRRVKCDEARPQCRRCTVGKRICTGYRRDPGNISKSKEQINEIGGMSLPHWYLLSSKHDAVLTADPMAGAIDDHPNEAFDSSTGWNVHIEINTDRPHVSHSIISIVKTCFEGLTDSVHSLETRRLMLQNYQIATKLLRSALEVDAKDRSLEAPMRALALYEVRCTPSCLVFYPD